MPIWMGVIITGLSCIVGLLGTLNFFAKLGNNNAVMFGFSFFLWGMTALLFSFAVTFLVEKIYLKLKSF
jgi:hypothetical protein